MESCCRQGKRRQLFLCVGERRRLGILAQIEAFRIDEFHVGNADEAQEIADVGGLAAYYHLDDQALSAVPAIEPHGIQRFHVGQ